MGIAQIGQVADLHAFVQHRILDLDKVADMHIFGQFRAGAQAGERANAGPARDMTAFQMAEGMDHRTRFHGDTGAEDHIRRDDRIAADMGVQREKDGVRGGQGHAILQRFGAHGGLEGGFGLRQLGAGVDAQRFRLIADHHAGGQAAVAGQAHDVRQIVLPGGIGGAKVADKVSKQRDIGADNT